MFSNGQKSLAFNWNKSCQLTLSGGAKLYYQSFLRYLDQRSLIPNTQSNNDLQDITEISKSYGIVPHAWRTKLYSIENARVAR